MERDTQYVTSLAYAVASKCYKDIAKSKMFEADRSSMNPNISDCASVGRMTRCSQVRIARGSVTLGSSLVM